MATIQATRLGFCFQDKYACLLFLRELRAGNIKEFYVDYPVVGTQLSLDIMYKIGTGAATKEVVHEVKTGECFKRDKKGPKAKESSEVRDAIQTFSEYSKNVPNFEGYVSFTKGLKSGLNQYIGLAKTLHINAVLNTDDKKQAAKDMIGLLRLDELGTQKAVHGFFKQTQFNELPYSNEQTWTMLDEHIAAEIDGIANAIGVHDHVYELPSGHLASRLLDTVQKYAGSGEDAAKEMLSEVMAFMSRRKLLGDYTPNGASAQLQGNAKQYVTEKMIDNFKVEDLVQEGSSGTPHITASDTGTGGVVS